MRKEGAKKTTGDGKPRNRVYVSQMTLHQLATHENKRIHLLNKALEEPEKLTELNEEGHSPLVSAVINGREKNVLILAGCGADVNERFEMKVVDILCDILRGNRFSKDEICDIGDMLCEPSTSERLTPLYYAILVGHEGMVRALLYMGAKKGCARAIAKKFLPGDANDKTSVKARVLSVLDGTCGVLSQWDADLFSIFLKKHRECANSTISARINCLVWIKLFYNRSSLYEEYGEWLDLSDSNLHKLIQLLKEAPEVQVKNKSIGGTLIPALDDYEEYVMKCKRLRKSGL